MIAVIARFSRRFASQAVISGSVMVALHAIGGGAGLYALIFGHDGTVGPSRDAPLGARGDVDRAGKSARLTRQAEAEPIIASASFVSPQPAAEPARALKSSAGQSRDLGRDLGHGLAIPSGVTLFTECRTRCESHDPRLVENETPAAILPVASLPIAARSDGDRAAGTNLRIAERNRHAPAAQGVADRVTAPISNGARFVSHQIGSLIDGAGDTVTALASW
ncbi:hypothetical protein LQ948_12310 [Jiella sp. MQZ9-1]|uniref:Uncharacterized protein n=1 Tax=Jiella flava TaxID=2816857 RepID=A0A939G0N9_9HYPH|nr:hypothetical protein [Jiella flava]MBO0663418.1 hypothetical protein [Jiella flava]MCD2471994.1 hypothetical protein [Jiella flava]